MGGLFKLYLEPLDVAERVFVKFEVERLHEHLGRPCLKREGRFLVLLGNDSVFSLYLLISRLYFVGVDSLKEREEGEVADSGVTVD